MTHKPKKNFRVKISKNISDLYIINNILCRLGIRSKYFYICIIFYGLHRQKVFRNRTSASLFPGETTGAFVYKARLSTLARIWPKKGRFPMILEEIFLYLAKGPLNAWDLPPKVFCVSNVYVCQSFCVFPPPAFFRIALSSCFNLQHCFLWKKVNEEYIHVSLMYKKTYKQHKKSLII